MVHYYKDRLVEYFKLDKVETDDNTNMFKINCGVLQSTELYVYVFALR